MRLLLRRTLENVGKIGEVVNVSDGFGRNYLLPQRLAVAVTPDNRRMIEGEKIIEAKREAERRDAAMKLAKQIDGVEVVITAKAQDDDTLFGAVTPKEIAERLRQTKDLGIEWRQLKIAEPIRRLGDYEVEIKLHTDVMGHLKVKVVREQED